ncbi:MAG: NAD(P)H-binding protein [Crocinitomicaceae bacterium]|nr:NAD(P)H-binding protein [Crocinitomicaceae bacterium]
MVTKSAIILGATGLTGSLVLEHLLANENYNCIKLFSRNSCGITHPKLEEHLVDVLNLEAVKSDFIADEVYCCIGTTKKKTPNQETYTKIDFGIPAEAAKLCAENKIPVMAVVSAIGADTKSKFFYNRTKGMMEQAVVNAGIERTYILRPSLITGNRKEKRSGEKLSIAIFKFLQFLFIGKLRRYRAVNADAIAKRMIELANSNEPSKIVESNEI